MDTTGFQRSVWTRILSAGSMTAIVACFAIGQARAQFVNPVPPPPPPTFNPSSPNTVPQPPYVPVAPAAPGGLPGSEPVPNSPVTVAPSAVTPEATTPAAAVKSAPSKAPVSHEARLARHRSNRHGRAYAARMIGPSYYPGLGLIYPPYPDPCHFSPMWHGYWVGYLTYTCS
jgi:hypothetical protein